MKREYERVPDDDPDVLALREYELDLQSGRIDALDPLAILELCEEFGVTVSYLLTVLRRKSR